MSTMTRLAAARPEVAARPHTVVPPSERATLFRTITGAAPTASPYVGEGDTIDLSARRRRSPRPLLLAAAVVLVVAAVGAGLVLRGDDGGQTPTTPPVTVPGVDELPAGFDPATARPVFTAGGDVFDVLAAYFADLYDRDHAPTLTITSDTGDLVTADWQLPTEPDATVANGDDDAVLAHGEVFLRRIDEQWSVVGSTIDGIDLSTLQNTGDRVTGAVGRGEVTEPIYVDLLGPTGMPVVEDIEDDEMPRRASIPVDVPVAGPVILRVTVLGGGVLGVAEVALDPPAAVPTEPEVTPSPLPAGFDPATATPIFTAEGDLDAVAGAYVADRWHPAALPTTTVLEDTTDRAVVGWEFGTELEGVIAEGRILLRSTPEGWAVVASEIDGIDLSQVRIEGGQVVGTVTSANLNSLALDVLGDGRLPVPGSPEEGLTDVDGNRFATAGIVQTGAEAVDLAVPAEGATVFRAQLVGGSILGVAEFALDPAPVVRRMGDGDVSWLVRSEQTSDGWCVGLDSGAGRVCTSSDDELWSDGVWFLQLGPTVRRGGHVLVTGFVNPAVESIQVRRADGSELDTSTSRLEVGTGAFVVAAVPVVDGPVSVDLRGATGVLDTVELSGLLPVGG